MSSLIKGNGKIRLINSAKEKLDEAKKMQELKQSIKSIHNNTQSKKQNDGVFIRLYEKKSRAKAEYAKTQKNESKDEPKKEPILILNKKYTNQKNHFEDNRKIVVKSTRLLTNPKKSIESSEQGWHDYKSMLNKFRKSGIPNASTIEVKSPLFKNEAYSSKDIRRCISKQLSPSKPTSQETFKPITLPPDQSQFLETRKFQINEIARIFRIPPHMIGDLERATFSNIENQSLEFVKYTLDPWVVRLEMSFQRALLRESEKRDYFIKLNVDGLLRGDYASRMQGYATGIQNGFLSPNDVRRLEDMNTIEHGDIYAMNGNMLKLQDVGAYARTLDKKEGEDNEKVLELGKE